jgi:prolyl-tRNA synthetase
VTRERIFARLGLDYVIVRPIEWLMGGARGGISSLTLVGEDAFVRSAGGYA